MIHNSYKPKFLSIITLLIAFMIPEHTKCKTTINSIFSASKKGAQYVIANPEEVQRKAQAYMWLGAASVATIYVAYRLGKSVLPKKKMSRKQLKQHYFNSFDIEIPEDILDPETLIVDEELKKSFELFFMPRNEIYDFNKTKDLKILHLHGPSKNGKKTYLRHFCKENNFCIKTVQCPTLQGGLIGDSEKNIHQAFSIVNDMAGSFKQKIMLVLQNPECFLGETNLQKGTQLYNSSVTNSLAQCLQNLGPNVKVAIVTTRRSLPTQIIADQTICIEKPSEAVRADMIEKYFKHFPFNFNSGEELLAAKKLALDFTKNATYSLIDKTFNMASSIASKNNQKYLNVEMLQQARYLETSKIVKSGDQNDFQGYMPQELQTSDHQLFFPEKIKESATLIIEMLKDEQLNYTKIGAKKPKGTLLYGPPGTGKTALARYIAANANAVFFHLKNTSEVKAIEQVFETARSTCRHAIIFIDEIDQVATKREKDVVGYNRAKLTKLLEEIDGFGTSDDLIHVIGATNLIDSLDEAILRAGRIEKHIKIEYLGSKTTLGLLKELSSIFSFEENINWEDLAENIEGSSGARIKQIVNEAAILAAKNGRTKISYQDVIDAECMLSMGLNGRENSPSQEELYRTTIHELGHAFAMIKQPAFKHKFKRITISQFGKALGHAAFRPCDENLTEEALKASIIVYFAGLVMEEICLGNHDTGCYSDLTFAQNIVEGMIHAGMIKDASGKIIFTAKKKDSLVNEVLNQCKKECTNLLKAHKNSIEKMANILLERKTLSAKEFELELKKIEGK